MAQVKSSTIQQLLSEVQTESLTLEGINTSLTSVPLNKEASKESAVHISTPKNPIF